MDAKFLNGFLKLNKKVKVQLKKFKRKKFKEIKFKSFKLKEVYKMIQKSKINNKIKFKKFYIVSKLLDDSFE